MASRATWPAGLRVGARYERSNSTQPEREQRDAAGDDPHRRAGAGPTGPDPGPQLRFGPGALRELREQRAELAGATLGGGDEPGDDEVGDRVIDVVGEGA